MRAPTWATTAAGPLKWVAAVDMGLDIYGAGKATYDLYQSYQDNGRFEWQDAWNLLNYLPFAGAVLGGAKTFLRANKNVKKSAQGIDDVLTSSTKNVETNVGKHGGLRCSSFIAGTEILTAEGEKNIEDIEIGDWVIADDPTTPGEIEKRQVLSTFSREADEIFDLYVDGEIISTTAEHAFWTRDEGWVDASDLEVGDWLQTDEETFVDVDRIERREGKTTVYNFEVEGFPTYFVSEHGILVHNAGCDPSGPGTFFKKGEDITLSDDEVLSHAVRIYNRAPITKTRGSVGVPDRFSPGHSGKHDFPKDLEPEIINNAERIFFGLNKNNRVVTIFYKGGDAVITQDNDFSRVITAYGLSGKEKKPPRLDKWIKEVNEGKMNEIVR